MTGVQVEELYSLNNECIKDLGKVYGLIFLFKWVPDNFTEGKLLTDIDMPELFFAKQTINNACATQALINILLNCKDKDIELGDNLKNFKEFTASFCAKDKGDALTNLDAIRLVHNSFARSQMFDFDGIAKKKEKEDAFHFIGYVPYNGRLIELDGLKAGPYDLGPIGEQEQWVEVARPHIEKRMQKYSAGEIHFNLMALVKDALIHFNQKIVELSAVPDSQVQIEHYKQLIEEEEEKRKRYKAENIRRKHNYLPLIMETLKALGRKGKLLDAYEKALGKAKADIEKEKAKAKSEKDSKGKAT